MPCSEYTDIHHWFGLSYSSYMVLPRSVLEAMPVEWQKKMLELIEEIENTFDLSDAPGTYTVLARKGNKFIQDSYRNYRRPRKLNRKDTINK